MFFHYCLFTNIFSNFCKYTFYLKNKKEEIFCNYFGWKQRVIGRGTQLKLKFSTEYIIGGHSDFRQNTFKLILKSSKRL